MDFRDTFSHLLYVCSIAGSPRFKGFFLIFFFLLYNWKSFCLKQGHDNAAFDFQL